MSGDHHGDPHRRGGGAHRAGALTIQNSPDGTYRYEGRSEDTGSFAGADRQWRATSLLSRKSDKGTYRVVDSQTVEITASNGPTLWQRQWLLAARQKCADTAGVRAIRLGGAPALRLANTGS